MTITCNCDMYNSVARTYSIVIVWYMMYVRNMVAWNIAYSIAINRYVNNNVSMIDRVVILRTFEYIARCIQSIRKHYSFAIYISYGKIPRIVNIRVVGKRYAIKKKNFRSCRGLTWSFIANCHFV